MFSNSGKYGAFSDLWKWVAIDFTLTLYFLPDSFWLLSFLGILKYLVGWRLFWNKYLSKESTTNGKSANTEFGGNRAGETSGRGGGGCADEPQEAGVQHSEQEPTQARLLPWAWQVVTGSAWSQGLNLNIKAGVWVPQSCSVAAEEAEQQGKEVLGVKWLWWWITHVRGTVALDNTRDSCAPKDQRPWCPPVVLTVSVPISMALGWDTGWEERKPISFNKRYCYRFYCLKFINGIIGNFIFINYCKIYIFVPIGVLSGFL